MSWLYLVIGIVGEVIWVMTLKSTDGFTRLWPSMFNLSLAALNLWVLSLAFRNLPTALAYAIWVGASAAAVAVCASYFHGEPMTLAKWAYYFGCCGPEGD